jgi:hypothetical protein
MARGLGDYVRGFFNNWRASDDPVPQKLSKATRNRFRAVARGGCCGHRGEPGC